MLSNECATLYKKTDVSNKRVQRKTAVQTKQPPKKKGDQKIIALFSKETKLLKHKLKINKTWNKTYELKQTNAPDSHQIIRNWSKQLTTPQQDTMKLTVTTANK